MKNLVLAILAASTAILGFYAYQTSQKVTGLQGELSVRETALTTLEGEKAALEEQLAAVQAKYDQAMAAAEAEAEPAPANEATEATAPAEPAEPETTPTPAP